MAGQPSLQATGEHIEALLDEMRSSVDPRSYRKVEELVRQVTDLYGAALGRVVEVVSDLGPAGLDALVSDGLVSALLVVHDLHPEEIRRRVERALAGVRPLLAAHGGDVELVDIDEAAQAVLIRLLGSCDGCPSSAITLQLAVEAAIRDAAPEIATIDVEGSQPTGATTSVELIVKPVHQSCPAGVVPA